MQEIVLAVSNLRDDLDGPAVRLLQVLEQLCMHAPIALLMHCMQRMKHARLCCLPWRTHACTPCRRRTRA